MEHSNAAPLEARYQLNADDNKAFQTLAKKGVSNAPQKLIRSMLALFALLLVASVTFRASLNRNSPRPARPSNSNPLTTLIPLALPIIVFTGFYFVILQSNKKAALKRAAFVEPTAMRLAESAVTHVCGPYTNITQWRGIARVISDEKHIIFMVEPERGYIVPRRAFEDDESWQRFIRFASENWQKTQPTVPPIANA